MTQTDAHGHEYTRDGGVKGKERLTIAGIAKMWPTPRVGGHEGYETRAKRKGHDMAMSYLESAVEYHEQKLWPTPSANEDAAGTPNGKMQKMLGNHPAIRITGEGTLNAAWVEWLMGYPRNWTAEGETIAHDGFDSEPSDIPRVAVGVPNRVKRLKALGNAVVPQIPEILGRMIMEAEHGRA